MNIFIFNGYRETNHPFKNRKEESREWVDEYF